MKYEEWLLKEKKLTRKAYKKLSSEKKVELYIEFKDSKVKCPECGGVMISGGSIWGSEGIDYGLDERSYSLHAKTNQLFGGNMRTVDLTVSVCTKCGNVKTYMDKKNRELFFDTLADLRYHKK